MVQKIMRNSKSKVYIEALRKFRKVIPLIKSINDVTNISSDKVLYIVKELLEGLMLLKGVNPPSSLDLTNVAAFALDHKVINPKQFALIAELNVACRSMRLTKKYSKLYEEIVHELLKLANEIDPYVSLDAEIFRY